MLEYIGSVWDPSGVNLQNELEKVQNRAARFVTGSYNFETGSMTGILEHSKRESLKKRRRDSRLILLYKGLKDEASIPTDDLNPLVRRCRNHHSMAYQVPIAKKKLTESFSVCHNHKPQPTQLRGREKGQKHTCAKQTNAQEAKRPAPSSPNEMIRMLK